MPKQPHLEKHHSSEELKNRYFKSKDPVESRRWHLIWKVSLGWSIKNSANTIGLNYEYGKEIVKKCNSLGAQGLKNLKRKGRKKTGGKQQLLNDQQIEKLKQEIAKRPSDGGIWTGVKVARWIELENR